VHIETPVQLVPGANGVRKLRRKDVRYNYERGRIHHHLNTLRVRIAKNSTLNASKNPRKAGLSVSTFVRKENFRAKFTKFLSQNRPVTFSFAILKGSRAFASKRGSS
jgi:hypothetical protein